MSRAARLLAGATLMGVSACSSTEPAPVPLYGGPFPVDSGAGGAAGNDAATGAGGAPANGAGGAPATDAGGLVPIYGAPIRTDGGKGG